MLDNSNFIVSQKLICLTELQHKDFIILNITTSNSVHPPTLLTNTSSIYQKMLHTQHYAWRQDATTMDFADDMPIQFIGHFTGSATLGFKQIHLVSIFTKFNLSTTFYSDTSLCI